MSWDGVKQDDGPSETAKSEVVASLIREAIEQGDYGPGDRLPSQGDLAARFRTSRPTVQLALRQLETEGVILPTQRGRRSAVAGTPRGGPAASASVPGTAINELEHAVERAFAEPQVSIDFWGFTAETLFAAVQQPFTRIRQERLTPDSVHFRLMLPAEGAHLALPRSVADPRDGRPLERLRLIRERHSRLLRTTFHEMNARRPGSYRLEIRGIPITPTFKLCMLNNHEALFGYYRVSEWDMPLPDGDVVRAYDIEGFKVPMERYEQADRRFDTHRSWFANYWNTIAEETSDPA